VPPDSYGTPVGFWNSVLAGREVGGGLARAGRERRKKNSRKSTYPRGEIGHVLIRERLRRLGRLDCHPSYAGCVRGGRIGQFVVWVKVDRSPALVDPTLFEDQEDADGPGRLLA